MTQEKINKAYPALFRLSEFRLPIKKARCIYIMLNNISEHFQFALSEERKAISEYGGEEQADGTVLFKESDNLNKFRSRISELNSSVIEWDLEPVVLEEHDIGAQLISPSDILNLEGFVIFE